MFGRHRRRDPADLVDEIRRTLVTLDDQRRLAADAAGRALVNQAEVRRACHEQLSTLANAFGVAENAETLARRAAGDAEDADDADLVAFEQTAAGLQSVQGALGAAAEPIHTLLAEARDNVERARAVLGRARDVLDEQIREQLRLLRTLERIERDRIVAAARRAR